MAALASAAKDFFLAFSSFNSISSFFRRSFEVVKSCLKLSIRRPCRAVVVGEEEKVGRNFVFENAGVWKLVTCGNDAQRMKNLVVICILEVVE